MKIIIRSFLFLTFLNGFSQEIEESTDSLKVFMLEEVKVSSIRAKKTDPVTHSNLDKEDIKSRNLGQDIPILLNYLPGVVTTIDEQGANKKAKVDFEKAGEKTLLLSFAKLRILD